MYDPKTNTPLLVPASCPVPDRPQGAPALFGKLKIKVIPNSVAFRIYQQSDIEERFACSYELNLAFREKLEGAGMRITGFGENGEGRIVELPKNRFYLATLYQPHMTSEAGKPHPLITAYLKAAIGS